MTLVSGYKWPADPRHDTLERFIYEGVNPAGDGMFGVLGECSIVPRGKFQGTTTAATWLRMVRQFSQSTLQCAVSESYPLILQAYHDSATFNITDQTGGLDASIHFELDRPEVSYSIGVQNSHLTFDRTSEMV